MKTLSMNVNGPGDTLPYTGHKKLTPLPWKGITLLLNRDAEDRFLLIDSTVTVAGGLLGARVTPESPDDLFVKGSPE